MHERMRRELWGYAPDEALSNDDLIAEQYEGIRPAPGYPAVPDHTEKATLFRLLGGPDAAPAGIALTKMMAMLPSSGGLRALLWRPESAFFGVGRIGRNQLEDYAARKGDRSRSWRAGWRPTWTTDCSRSTGHRWHDARVRGARRGPHRRRDGRTLDRACIHGRRGHRNRDPPARRTHPTDALIRRRPTEYPQFGDTPKQRVAELADNLWNAG